VRLPDPVLVALGGAAGAVARYGVGLLAVRWAGMTGLPAGTWVVNALGCVGIGLAMGLGLPERVRLVVVVGVLGGFTTFSAYSAETVMLWTAGRPGWATANAIGSVLVGVAGVALGLALGRSIAP
jgi:CrcB protein